MSFKPMDHHARDGLPANPKYGSGCFRRHIRLTQEHGAVVAELEDDCHGFRVRLEHDGSQVTAVNAETIRFPYTTCSGAAEPIKKLCGISIDSDTLTIRQSVNPFSNCTHLFDLSVLAMKHATRDEKERFYEVQVDDEKDGLTQVDAFVRCNGREVLRYQVHSWQIIGPEEVAGAPFFKGFTAWANGHYQGDLLEAALILQKGYFVSSARRYDSPKIAGRRGDSLPYASGACYTYTEGTVQQATRIPDTIRDFTYSPEQLLRFE